MAELLNPPPTNHTRSASRKPPRVGIIERWYKGYRPDIMRRLLCFSLFWHALDIVWVAIFSTVYLIGVAA